MAARWTREEISWLEENFNDNDISQDVLEKHLGRNWNTIWGKALRLGLKRKRDYDNNPWSNKEWLYQQYITKDKQIYAIAKENNVCRGTIDRWVIEHNLRKERNIPTKQQL